MLSYELATARAWAEIDLDKVLSNYQSALDELSPGVAHFAVLKANAYGFGAVGMAKALYGAGCRLFAFACVSEAIEISRALPGDATLLVMGETADAEMDLLFAHHITPTVFSYRKALLLSQRAQALDTELHFHCKVDTGLNRLGFSMEEAVFEIARIAALPGLVLDGVFSHLQRRSKAHDIRQAERLLAVHEGLQAQSVAVPMLHMLDSIGMWRYPAYQLGAIRDGAYLLGSTPKDYPRPERIQFALSVKARVVRIHEIEAGECVGYDADHPLPQKTRVATLSIGYADGYPRDMSHVGQVEIHGKRARVVGVVCMDVMMVDINEIPETRENDIATLLGGGIGIHEFAECAGGYANDYMSRLSRRVPRVYIQGGKVIDIQSYL